jgi:hypothetical protein
LKIPKNLKSYPIAAKTSDGARKKEVVVKVECQDPESFQ